MQILQSMRAQTLQMFYLGIPKYFWEKFCNGENLTRNSKLF